MNCRKSSLSSTISNERPVGVFACSGSSCMSGLSVGVAVGFTVYEAEQGEKAMEILALHDISLVISDVRMPI